MQTRPNKWNATLSDDSDTALYHFAKSLLHLALAAGVIDQIDEDVAPVDVHLLLHVQPVSGLRTGLVSHEGFRRPLERRRLCAV